MVKYGIDQPSLNSEATKEQTIWTLNHSFLFRQQQQQQQLLLNSIPRRMLLHLITYYTVQQAKVIHQCLGFVTLKFNWRHFWAFTFKWRPAVQFCDSQQNICPVPRTATELKESSTYHKHMIKVEVGLNSEEDEEEEEDATYNHTLSSMSLSRALISRISSVAFRFLPRFLFFLFRMSLPLASPAIKACTSMSSSKLQV